MSAEKRLSRRGFPLLIDETPKLRNLRLPDVYPRYGFGWIVPARALMRLAEEKTGKPCLDHLTYGLRLLREAGLPDGEYDFWPLFPHGQLTTLWYIATNESPEKRDLASNKEYVGRAKAALGQTEEGKWYHMDLF
ncbi:uncharacterized protein SCHCODRAFT_02676203 [Schizophyllum commune H4-8]|uniref:uncharacterized protein n=1 Tax=Schizophyllum commune (strain H4-8 / FGSC 9210) TaxID=578458 RepID=UPI00215F6DB0|nr:uncharacterized protein SCHCODRAFT_02676203 [Schizophyllum commune H4-8]KAI5896444.1 hypothetical protein SCHCODRAFT_02676203 [Schizophyllum commune H4-8]